MLKIVPKTPQQNGVAKRMNQTLNERAKSMRLHAGLPKMFWEDSVTTTAYLINRGPSVPLELVGSLDASDGSKNSGSFEDSERSDEEDSEDRASYKEGGSEKCYSSREESSISWSNEAHQDKISLHSRTGELGNVIFEEDSWRKEPCIYAHQGGDNREVEALRSLNWPPR
nr:retrovirus-related Pol polyprotein from transposon TNT 1-94 [Tanacetum cinerariifolium]